MKSLNLIIGIVFLFLNVMVGLLLSSYATHTCVITSSVIAITTLLNHLSSNLHIKDAFKVSLPFIFSVLGIIEYALGFFVEKSIKNDYCLIAILVLLAIQVAMFVCIYIVSNNKN